MQKNIFTLILVVIIGILVGVAVVKQQAGEPLLREILHKQQTILQAQSRIERKIEDAEKFLGAGGPQALQGTPQLQVLENRIAALEAQLKIFQQDSANAGAGGEARQAPPPEDLTTVHNIPVAHSPVKGNKNASVTIVEFVDFQCPFCARFHPPIIEVLKAYPKDVNYVLKNFPLPFHQQAKSAAKAAFSAGEQGKYWEMVDVLLANGKSLSEEKYEGFAKDLGLDVQKFKDDYADKEGRWEAYIQADMDLAQKVNARGTPTFYINGRKTRARDFNSLKAEIDQILSGKK